MTRQIDSLRRNTTLFDRVLEKAHRRLSGGGGLEAMATADVTEVDRAAEMLRAGRFTEAPASAEEARTRAALEAIILAEMRPAYLILGDKIEIAGDYDHLDLLRQNKAMLESLGRNVGRVDLISHYSLPYAGTGWLVEDDIVVTNRHVAEIFAERSWSGGYSFGRGAFDRRLEVRLDTLQQKDDLGVERDPVQVREILYVAGAREPDIAFLRIARRDDLAKLELAAALPEPDMPVAAIGYPASDLDRNPDPELMKQYFGGIYDVKRFSPGLVTALRENDVLVLADYTSLGGNSGSAVLDLDTGKAMALHFAGVFRDTNYAVAADVVKTALARVRSAAAVSSVPAVELPPSSVESFAGRRGYDPEFLGADDLAVPLPSLGALAEDVAPVADNPSGHLNYTHFTVIQSKSRRLPRITAVNIDGARSYALKRRGTWRLDGRIATEHQIGNELYTDNPFDRGHMVRRRDPGWGASRAEAQDGETDTFHYTNSAPQHEDLNQKDWVGLEDYILEAAETRDFKVSVFTGPIFRDGDRRLRPGVGSTEVQIPEEFWKVAVMVNNDTGRLSATGYVLSQGAMIRGLTEAAFVFGEYATYQVRVKAIEAATGLDFDRLRDADPLAREPETVFGHAAFRVDGPQSLRL